MFVNYFANPHRSSPLNLAVARVGLGLYAIWKLLSYDFEELDRWPGFLFQQHAHGAFLWGSDFRSMLPVEVMLAVALLVAFIVGYRLGFVCVAASALILHLTSLHYVVTNSATTFLPVTYALMIWALFRDHDVLTMDARIKSNGSGFPNATDTAKPTVGDPSFSMAPLKWMLVIVATTYFFTGMCKLQNAGMAWLEPDNLRLMIRRDALMHLDRLPESAAWIMQYRWVASVSTLATIAIECGFIILVLAKRSITLVVCGVFALHTMILLTMGIFFFDQYLLMLLFVPWDELLANLNARRADAALPLPSGPTA